jgi:TonB-linked SusC/RagA family outer membrane protein
MKPNALILIALMMPISATAYPESTKLPLSFNDEKFQVAQQKTINGTVSDEFNHPLLGVTVVEKGTSNGTITNTDGAYSLSNISSGATLVFSFVGMRTQEIVVGNQSAIHVTMVVDAIGLEEVVAIGYGGIKKSDLTGAVGSVSGSDISERKRVKVSEALQGAIAGLTVTRDNTAPGAEAIIRIRGITTIGDSNPLIILDGVPVDNIDQINPNDIKDISVLKDAASASIYGARAAAGVILITTERAQEGKIELTYNAEYGVEKPIELTEYVDVVRHMEIENELRWNDKRNIGDQYSVYPQHVVDNYDALHAEDPFLYPNTDWWELTLKKYAPRTSHDLTLSAGTASIRSKFSLSYDKIDGLYERLSYQRVMTRFNNDFKINDFISASADIYLKRSILDDTNSGDSYEADPDNNVNVIYTLRRTPAIYPAFTPDGRPAYGKSGTNIVAQLKYGGWLKNYDHAVGGRISLDFTPIDGLKFSAVFSPNLNFKKSKDFRKVVKFYDADDPTIFLGYSNWYNTTKVTEARNEDILMTTQFLLNYTKSLGNHHINVLAGYENFFASYEVLGASRDHYTLTAFPYLDIGPLEYRDNYGREYQHAYRSWFGRIMYNFRNKYYLQSNIRYDGSSRFHEDYRWGAFPSFSAAWVLSRESFLQGSDWLSFLKLRASWGVLGNERIGYYPYQAKLEFSNVLFNQGTNVVSVQSAAQKEMAVQNITWETTGSYDIGIDFYLFDNKMRFTGDYYQKTTKGMLLELEIPDFIGLDNPEKNTGNMETRGWEMEFAYINRIGDFNYAVSFHLSDYTSVFGDLGGIEFIGSQIKREGSEFNEWYGYLSDGIFMTQEEVDGSPLLSSETKPGDIKYLDVSGPDGVPDGIINAEYDRVLLGGSLPRFQFGGNIRLDFKGLELSVVIQGVGKQNSLLNEWMVRPLIGNVSPAPAIIDGNYWSHYNTPEQNEKAKYPRLSQTNAPFNYAMSDYWLFNGGYLRLKNLTIAYNLPGKLTSRIGMEGIRIYTSMSDILSISKYPPGWDPEECPSGWDPEGAGTGYPITSSYMLGLTVKF